MDSKFKVLGKRLYWPNLRDLVVLQSILSRFLFPIHLPASFREKIINKWMGIWQRDWTLPSGAKSLKFGQYKLLPSTLPLLFINCSELSFKKIICNQIAIQTQWI